MVRLDAYEKQTKPLIEFYQERDLLVSVNGNQEIHKVLKDIVKELGE